MRSLASAELLEVIANGAVGCSIKNKMQVEVNPWMYYFAGGAGNAWPAGWNNDSKGQFMRRILVTMFNEVPKTRDDTLINRCLGEELPYILARFVAHRNRMLRLKRACDAGVHDPSVYNAEQTRLDSIGTVLRDGNPLNLVGDKTFKYNWFAVNMVNVSKEANVMIKFLFESGRVELVHSGRVLRGVFVKAWRTFARGPYNFADYESVLETYGITTEESLDPKEGTALFFKGVHVLTDEEIEERSRPQ